MTLQTEEQLIALAGHFDLEIKYVNDLPDNVPGILQAGAESGHIIVNARKSRSDQAFTIAHELAHYVMHLDRPPLYLVPRYLDHPWKPKFMTDSTQETKDFLHRKFGPEFQADLWAFILLWQIRAFHDLIAIPKLYPRLKWMLWYSLAAVIYGVFKKRVKNLIQTLSSPFHTQ
ncbi:MAG TPA: ImmA/IrrE family metallo-endopeptidase [Candidatus Acidoferrales bacterium]|nr:ImmA/IrrE family metallo-endopeptidase [Candidatus Acidoferrales bacterium]